MFRFFVQFGVTSLATSHFPPFGSFLSRSSRQPLFPVPVLQSARVLVIFGGGTLPPRCEYVKAVDKGLRTKIGVKAVDKGVTAMEGMDLRRENTDVLQGKELG